MMMMMMLVAMMMMMKIIIIIIVIMLLLLLLLLQLWPLTLINRHKIVYKYVIWLQWLPLSYKWN